MQKKKKKKTPSPKRGKTAKKRSDKQTDPEWEFLEERGNTMSTDFNRLAELIPRKQK